MLQASILNTFGSCPRTTFPFCQTASMVASLNGPPPVVVPGCLAIISSIVRGCQTSRTLCPAPFGNPVNSDQPQQVVPAMCDQVICKRLAAATALRVALQ